MTPTRRSALVQLASMLKSAHGQLSEIYRAEQRDAQRWVDEDDMDDSVDIIIDLPVHELAGALQLLHGSIENMVSDIEHKVPP